MSQGPSGYTISFPAPPITPSVVGQTLNGFGPPPNTNGPSVPYGQNGDTYVDLLTGTVYSKSEGNWAQISGSGGASVQLVVYTSGLPSPPAKINQPALAYDPTGVLPTLGWNVNTQSWV